MPMKLKQTTFNEFEELIKELGPERFHDLMLSYISETNHQGWEFSPRDQTGIRNFLDDVMLYRINREETKIRKV